MRKVLIAALGMGLSWSAHGALVSVSQNSVPNLDPVPPQVEASPLGEESFAYADRTHELTAARVDPTTGLLTTNSTLGVVVPIPSYLLGAQYVANANDNRSAGTSPAEADYQVTYTVDTPGKAYLLLDNRLNGTASNGTSSASTTDPDLGGNLAWVINEGWTRVNTGIFPNGQADYIGIDEGGSVDSPNLRTHHDPGEGVSLNQFFAIYEKDIPAAGTFTTNGQRQGTGAGNMYVVAFASEVPEPSALGAIAGVAALGLLRRRKA